MLARSPLLAVILTIALYATGCTVQPGQKLLVYNSAGSELAKPKTATRDGTYALYPDDGLTPIARAELHRGQEYGFRRSDNGHIVGYAGDREYSLTAVLANEYVWKFQGKDVQK